MVQEAWEALGLMAGCIGVAVVLATGWPALLAGPLGWLLLDGGLGLPTTAIAAIGPAWGLLPAASTLLAPSVPKLHRVGV